MFCEPYIVLAHNTRITAPYCTGALPGFSQFNVCETGRLLPDRKHVKFTEIQGLWFDSLQPFLPCSWQQHVLLLLTPLQKRWAGLPQECCSIPQQCQTTSPCSQRCCPACFMLLQWKSPVVVMLIRIFRHERGGYARKHQLLEELSSPWLSQRWGLRDSQGTMLQLLVGNVVLP